MQTATLIIPVDNDLHLQTENGQVVVSSRVMSEKFGKQHKHVLESIENLKAQMSTAEFSALFIPSTYKASNGKINPEVLMNRDGFTLLAMGFTGKEALKWKLKYIEAFNKMEQALKEQPKQQVDTKSKDIEARLINAKVRQASIYLKIADRVNIPTYQQICYSKATEILNGEALIPLPKVEGKTYSATEIGEKLGISSNKVGSLANKHNLKTEEYGELVWDKSKHSNKQVQTFRYYNNVIPVMEKLLKEEQKTA